MTTHMTSQPAALSYKPKWRQLLQVTAITVAAMPVTILLHELGHYLAGLIFGFPNLVFHYGSVTDSSVEQNFPDWQIGLTAAAGPLVTIIFTIGCCVYVARRKPAMVAIILGIAAPVRALIIGFFYLMSLLRVLIRGEKYRGSQNFDEYNMTQALNISLPLFIAVELIFLLWAWWFLARKTPGKNRRLILLSILLGIILGIILWSFIGPVLLP